MIATFCEPWPIGKQDQRRQIDRVADPADALRLPCRQRAPGRTYDLERSGNARRVGGVEALDAREGRG